ncbi:MAG TPA: acetylglutamate kinase, partial [Ferruginibacter sp.]|nr:acetylglutamate kinase [Ferruginibacter sp.]
MDKLFIIKVGGNILDDAALQYSFLEKFASISAKKILVHGGGKIASAIGTQLGIKPNYVNGRRITDKETINLVTMVYGGLINKQLVAILQSLKCNAIGLTGADANSIPAIKRPVKEIDYGFVGDIENWQLAVHSWQLLLNNNLTPIVAPLTHDGKGQLLNTNADTIASALAIALSKCYTTRLIYCFEKSAVLENIDDENSAIHLMDKEKYKQLLAENKITNGILPKIENALDAIENGVKEVLIGNA